MVGAGEVGHLFYATVFTLINVKVSVTKCFKKKLVTDFVK